MLKLMMDTIIKMYGTESKEAIQFCRFVESGHSYDEKKAMYSMLLDERATIDRIEEYIEDWENRQCIPCLNEVSLIRDGFYLVVLSKKGTIKIPVSKK